MKIDYNKIPLYAKRFKTPAGYKYQTIYEHTWELLNNMDILFREYSAEIEDGLKKLNIDIEKFKYLLKLAAIYHDLGKANLLFQAKIRDKQKNKEVPRDKTLSREVPHNFLSLVFVDVNKIAEDIKNHNFTNSEWDTLLYTIAFSHDREFDCNIYNIDYFKNYIEKGVIHFLNNPDLYWFLNFISGSIDKDKIIKNTNFFWKKIKQFKIKMLEEILNFEEYNTQFKVLLKGFLHRLDHASSALVTVEEERIDDFPKKVELYLKEKGNFSNFKEFQMKAVELSDKNVILFAPTGSGKTEFGLNWAQKGKLIYTLPIRVSINAMYERFIRIFGEGRVGILHSDNFLFLLNDEEKYNSDEEIEVLFNNLNLSKNLSLPIIVTTGDQIFTSALKWPGFEKIYSLFLYSKLVIDEPQSYSPESLAIIIKTLEEVSYLNGKFCLMSATINPIIFNYFGDKIEYLQAYSDNELKNRFSHIISIRDNSILESIDEIIKEAKTKNVLVICNTVKRAQEVFKAVKEELKNSKELIKVELLHSRFIEKERRRKELAVLNGKDLNSIFISTQIVEASLDIDFDMLFTEISSADSILQRMGRVYRKRQYNSKTPNIVIFTKDISGIGRVYEEDITKRTIDYLKNFDGLYLSEYDKKVLNEYVYDLKEIKETRFMKKFNKTYDILKYGYRSENKSEAQKIFRDVFTVNAIPKSIYDENFEKLLGYLEKLNEKNLKPAEKIKLISNIRDYTVSAPGYLLPKSGASVFDSDLGIFIVNHNYDEQLGLISDEDDPNNYIL
ncbi:CRISPR-associated helicase/endonuclease Cas3 [Thermovenabulum gondwanense]|uniref:CRISPR-associated endonuclease/helicase Cas3 n=1 Tax=Thermovenabulum gondwanense TaxID=520767 RepID=A0A162MTW3_9FIRM|nr:CRISPR-associated helicase/endonuclease Cas3 [Thermovenabulum gondwanense]KYO67325.1 CRISPR-associated endonuclease/helicase Cas3 [Thermovenabulum gondwanense]